MAEVISIEEFKRRNDGFNEQMKGLEERLELLKAEELKSRRSVEQLAQIRAVLEQELSFENGINSALVTTILDHIVVKKGSTKEEIHLDIHLKFGGPFGVVFHRENSSFRFTLLLIMWATRRRLCSMRIFRASISPSENFSKYIRSSSAFNGRGKEPPLPPPESRSVTKKAVEHQKYPG